MNSIYHSGLSERDRQKAKRKITDRQACLSQQTGFAFFLLLLLLLSVVQIKRAEMTSSVTAQIKISKTSDELYISFFLLKKKRNFFFLQHPLLRLSTSCV